MHKKQNSKNLTAWSVLVAEAAATRVQLVVEAVLVQPLILFSSHYVGVIHVVTYKRTVSR